MNIDALGQGEFNQTLVVDGAVTHLTSCFYLVFEWEQGYFKTQNPSDQRIDWDHNYVRHQNEEETLDIRKPGRLSPGLSFQFQWRMMRAL